MPEIASPPVGSGPSPPPRVRAIFSDVDGTLLDHRQRTTAANCRALARAARAGAVVVLATGRTPLSARTSWKAAFERVKAENPDDELVQGLNITGCPGVYLQGNLVLDGGGNTIHVQRLESSVVKDAVAAVQASVCGVSVVAFLSDLRVVTTQRTSNIDLIEAYHDTVEVIKDLHAKGTGDEVLKLIFVTLTTRDRDKASEVLGEEIGDRGEVTLAGLPTMVELLPRGSSKGRGCQRLAGHLGIPAEEALVIGDAENDIQMLRDFPLSFAMGNAISEVKNEARFVTDRVDESGLAAAINSVF